MSVKVEGFKASEVFDQLQTSFSNEANKKQVIKKVLFIKKYCI